MSGAIRVVLNALFLDPAASGGPETYLRGLAPAVQELRPDASLTVVTTRRGAVALQRARWPERGIAIQELPCDEGQRTRRQFAEQILLPRLARRLRADVLHSLASVAPIRVRGVAHVITLHDVTFMHHSTFNRITTWGMCQVIPRAARRADALIAVTESSRDDICRTLGLSPGMFTVIPHGAGAVAARPSRHDARTRERFGLDGARIVLCVGAKRPHKNQAILIRALPQLARDVRLVLAGHPEPYEQTLRALASQLAVEDRVLFADWVAPDDLEALWSIAAVAAFPTLAEGFGLPLLEAMARGVPVAASDLPVFHELAGSWPIFFDPRDPADAARAIEAALTQPPEPERGRMIASRFTWRAAAEATWSVYDRCTSG